MTKLGRVMLSAITALATSLNRVSRKESQSTSKGGEKGNSRPREQGIASKSQRAMRIERGMRPRHTVGARKIERRAKHAIKGTPL